MSNETKRDVLVDAVDALADAQASGGNIGHQDANLFMAKYEKALPDDLPIIPKAVGEYIRAKKRKNASQSVYYLLRDTGVLWRRKRESKILSYMHDDPDTFARAWLLGVWCVEETGEIVKLEVKD